MKQRLLLFGSILLLVGALLACSSTDNAGIAATNTTPPSAPTKTPTTKHFKVGQTVKVGGVWDVKITKVKTSTGSQYDVPSSKDAMYLTIAVKMLNRSKEEQDCSIARFILRDQDGASMPEAIMHDYNPPSGKVEPGDPVAGTLVYEVPKTGKTFTLRFEANLLREGQTIWDIKV